MYTVKEITFFGHADAVEGEKLYQDAYETAKILAQNGYTVVQGGGSGVMLAAGLGAKAGGGQTIGVTYYPKETEGIRHRNFEGRDERNPLDKEIVTDSYVERVLTLCDIGDIYIFFNGGTGTLSEFGMAWGLAKIHFGHHKPLILYGSFWHEVMEVLAENMRIRETALKVYRIVDEPVEVLRALQDMCKQAAHFTC